MRAVEQTEHPTKECAAQKRGKESAARPPSSPPLFIPYLEVRQVEILPVVEKDDDHFVDLVRLSQAGDSRAAASDDDGDLGKRRMKEPG